jgi:competence protein ComEC
VIAAGESDATNPALRWDSEVEVAALNAGGGRAIGGDTESDWINNDSIVLRLSYGDVDLLMGGDAEAPVESRLITLGVPLESEVLKVHHHGVNDASTPAFLGAVAPRVGMIPIATIESYDGTLPSSAVLERLRQRRVHVYASDRAEALNLVATGDGGYHVTVRTDGRSYEVYVQPSQSRHYPGDAAMRPAPEEDRP